MIVSKTNYEHKKKNQQQQPGVISMNFKNLFTDSQKMFSIVVDGFDDC